MRVHHWAKGDCEEPSYHQYKLPSQIWCTELEQADRQGREYIFSYPTANLEEAKFIVTCFISNQERISKKCWERLFAASDELKNWIAKSRSDSDL